MEEIKQTVVVEFNDIDYVAYDLLDEHAKGNYDLPHITQTYENAIGYQLGSGFLGVQAADGTLTIYPQERIRQVTVSPKE